MLLQWPHAASFRYNGAEITDQLLDKYSGICNVSFDCRLVTYALNKGGDGRGHSRNLAQLPNNSSTALRLLEKILHLSCEYVTTTDDVPTSTKLEQECGSDGEVGGCTQARQVVRADERREELLFVRNRREDRLA